MSARITEALLPAAFEVVRNRMAQIIAEELAMQEYISPADIPDARVYAERFVPWNESELPAINVSLAQVNFDGHDWTQMDGTQFYYIDIFTGRNENTDEDGASLAQREMQHLAGIIMQIIQHSKYVKLGFDDVAFIQYRRVTGMKFADADRKEAFLMATGRIVVEVSTSEVAGVTIPWLLREYQTQVKLFNSNQGYLYFGKATEPMPGNPLDFIIDNPV